MLRPPIAIITIITISSSNPINLKNRSAISDSRNQPFMPSWAILNTDPGFGTMILIPIWSSDYLVRRPRRQADRPPLAVVTSKLFTLFPQKYAITLELSSSSYFLIIFMVLPVIIIIRIGWSGHPNRRSAHLVSQNLSTILLPVDRIILRAVIWNPPTGCCLLLQQRQQLRRPRRLNHCHP